MSSGALEREKVRVRERESEREQESYQMTLYTSKTDLAYRQSCRACHTTITEHTLPTIPFVKDTKLWEEHTHNWS